MRGRHREVRWDWCRVLVVVPFPVLAFGTELPDSLTPLATATPVLSMKELLLKMMLVFLRVRALIFQWDGWG